MLAISILPLKSKENRLFEKDKIFKPPEIGVVLQRAHCLLYLYDGPRTEVEADDHQFSSISLGPSLSRVNDGVLEYGAMAQTARLFGISATVMALFWRETNKK